MDENKYITLDDGTYDYHLLKRQGDVRRSSGLPVEIGGPETDNGG